MPRIASVTPRHLTTADPFQHKQLVVSRLGSLPVSTYAVSPSANNVDEGSALTIDITTANISDGTILRWRVIDRPGDFQINQNLIAIASNSASFTVTPKEDFLLEGPETFRVQLEKLSGTVVAVSSNITINDTSAVVLTVVPDETTVDEGDTVTFTVTLTSGTNPPGTVYYWTASSSQDFVVSSGSFTLTDGAATFSATLALDATEEGTETVTVSLRIGGIDGDIIATSPSITVNDTSVPTYAINSNFSSVNEGSPLVFFVSTTGVANGTTLYWTASSSDIDPQDGSFVVTGGTGSFAVVPSADATTEGPETFTVSIRTDSVSGTIRATSNTITINDTSVESTYAITPASSEINEGSSLTFTVTTTDVANGTTLYWTVSRPEDFEVSSGSFTINSNSGSFAVTPTEDDITEGPETFTASIRLGGVDGAILATSSIVTINDTTYSITPTANNVDEGNGLVFNVSTQGVPDGTTLYWTVSRPEDFFAGSGNFIINSNSGSFVVVPTQDATTEGAETFTASVRTGSVEGTVRATSGTITINDTSLTPTYSVSSDVNSVNEGDSILFTVSTTGVDSGTSIPYTLSGTGITTDDISVPLTGEIVVSGTNASSSGTLLVTVLKDYGEFDNATETLTLTLTAPGDPSVSVTLVNTTEIFDLIYTFSDPIQDAPTEYGTAIAVSNNYVVVGSPRRNNYEGRAYVYSLQFGTLIDTLYDNNVEGQTAVRFGTSVAANGALVWVGAPADYTGSNLSGSLYQYSVGGNFVITQDYRLFTDAYTPTTNGEFGYAVAANDAYVIVSAPNEGSFGFPQSDPGIVAIYNRTGTLIRSPSTPHVSNTTSRAGQTLAIAPGTGIVAFAGDSSSGANFFRIDTTSGLIRRTVPDGDTTDQFGFRGLATNGIHVAVGAPLYDEPGQGNTDNSGRVYVYTVSGFGLVNTIEAPAEARLFGFSVAMNADWLVIGAPSSTPGAVSGAGRVYVYRTSNFTLAYTIDSPDTDQLGFGRQVALSDDRLVVSRVGATGGSSWEGGAVYVYGLNASGF